MFNVSLTDQHLEMLAFEKQWWKYSGAKDQAVRDRFGVGLTRYYQVLNWVIDQPAALAAEPMIVRRLLRLRDARSAQRGQASRALS